MQEESSKTYKKTFEQFVEDNKKAKNRNKLKVPMLFEDKIKQHLPFCGKLIDLSEKTGIELSKLRRFVFYTKRMGLLYKKKIEVDGQYFNVFYGMENKEQDIVTAVRSSGKIKQKTKDDTYLKNRFNKHTWTLANIFKDSWIVLLNFAGIAKNTKISRFRVVSVMKYAVKNDLIEFTKDNYFREYVVPSEKLKAIFKEKGQTNEYK